MRPIRLAIVAVASLAGPMSACQAVETDLATVRPAATIVVSDPPPTLVGSFVAIEPPAEIRSEPEANAVPLEVVDTEIGAFVVDAITAGTTGQWLRLQYQWDRPYPVFGWYRVPRGTDVEETGVPCPDKPDLANVAALTPAERLHCFGGDALELVDVAIRPRAVPVAFGGEPAWLARDPQVEVWWDGSGTLGIHARDDFADVRPARRFRVVGHFDDPSAPQCRRVPLAAGTPPESPLEQILVCRQHFVLDDAIPTK